MSHDRKGYVPGEAAVKLWRAILHPGSVPVGRRSAIVGGIETGVAAATMAAPMLACSYDKVKSADQQNVYGVSDFFNQLYRNGKGSSPDFTGLPLNQPITVRGGAVSYEKSVDEYSQSLGSNTRFSVDLYNFYDPNGMDGRSIELHDFTSQIAKADHNDTDNIKPVRGSHNVNVVLSIARVQVENGDATDPNTGLPVYEFTVDQVAE